MAESIGAIIHMVPPTEEDLVRYFETAVYRAEQPTSTFHGSGKIILSDFVRKHGYKLGIAHRPSSISLIDPARYRSSTQLGVALPDAADLEFLVIAMENGAKRPQDHSSISEMSFSDTPQGRTMLGTRSYYESSRLYHAGDIRLAENPRTTRQCPRTTEELHTAIQSFEIRR
ncbi:hypothetical protein C8J56DRAFT_899787 [Mycena floridula]|nr:hypothetical protein C8J56DRAFT_899787 [Mycena floridula]